MLQCPYCHSSHVQLLGRSQHAQSETKLSFSPMALASVGMQISKRLGLNPLVGGFIGLTVGGVVLLYVHQQNNLVTLHYQCEQCQEHFEIQQTASA